VVTILKRALANPVTPLILGAAAALAGRGYILRSGVVFLCWIWFSVNIGRMVYEQPWQRHEKSISFVFLSTIALVITMLCVWWFLTVYVERGAH
jgi:hypothetical protein